MNPFLQVPIPEKKISYKKAPNGTLYVYYTLRAYRNEKGKPTSDEVSIGKKDPVSGMLIPNKNYWKYFPLPEAEKQTSFLPKSIRSVGVHTVCEAIAEQLPLRKILEEVFAEKAEDLLLLAFYMLSQGNVMAHLPHWLETSSKTPAGKTIRESRLFSEISEQQRLEFFQKWMKENVKQEYIVYDVTSISSYAKDTHPVEWGYNRDGEALPQINVGMFYGQQTRLPLFYSVYGGSITDKSYLPFMLRYADLLGDSPLRFVMDQGFVSKENLRFMQEKAYPFLTFLPKSLRYTKKLLTEEGNHIKTARQYLHRFNLYAKCVKTNYEGIDLYAHIYLDMEKAALEEKSLYERVELLRQELESLSNKKGLSGSRRYQSFFRLKKSGRMDIEYEMDAEKIDEQLQRAGYFVLITNDPSLNSEETLFLYRQKDGIEKAFDNLKNELDCKRLRTHTTKTMQGKIFVAFLALILRSQLQKCLQQAEEIRESLPSILRELDKITRLEMQDGSYAFMPLTKKQKELLKLFNVELLQ